MVLWLETATVALPRRMQVAWPEATTTAALRESVACHDNELPVAWLLRALVLLKEWDATMRSMVVCRVDGSAPALRRRPEARPENNRRRRREEARPEGRRCCCSPAGGGACGASGASGGSAELCLRPRRQEGTSVR